MTAHSIANRHASPATVRKNDHLAAARSGLDFFVREQIIDESSADHGRFPFVYRCDSLKTTSLTTNWTTGVMVQTLLMAARQATHTRYVEAAERAVAYLVSLQDFSPERPEMHGAFHEETPQDVWMHPRDALTAAWALLQYGQQMNQSDAIRRAELFGEWFLKQGMRDGYPAWTARFDGQPWEPSWMGSFHSGSALFLLRMHQHSGDHRYLDAARLILGIYNCQLLSPEGEVHVVVDRQSGMVLDGVVKSFWTTRDWEVMHVYNDDFGALANLALYRHTGEKNYAEAATRFLIRMAHIQREDGGFGPTEKSIPSATGMVVIEWTVARHLGLNVCSDEQLAHAVQHLHDLQVKSPGPARGAFLGFDGTYRLDGRTANARSGGYAVLALLLIGGAVSAEQLLDGA